jgi:hypothetical protein
MKRSIPLVVAVVVVAEDGRCGGQGPKVRLMRAAVAGRIDGAAAVLLAGVWDAGLSGAQACPSAGDVGGGGDLGGGGGVV